MVQFAMFTAEERKSVKRILDRAQKRHPGFNRMTLEMDLSAVHYHTPLRLAELADARDFDFFHDILGITDHIDRTTGQLRECFLPRYAA